MFMVILGVNADNADRQNKVISPSCGMASDARPTELEHIRPRKLKKKLTL